MKDIFNFLFSSVLVSIFLFADSSYPQAWLEQNSGVTVQLTSVSVPQPSNMGWICGYNGTVLRTSNMGTNWQNVSGNGIPATVQLVNICAIDYNIALTSGNINTATYLYRTTNGGANWSQVLFSASGRINAVVRIGGSQTNLLLQGNPVSGRWFLWKSTNGGVNWDSAGLYLPQSGSETGFGNSMFSSYVYNNSVWFGTSNSRLYYSTNAGATWTVQSTSPEVNSYVVWMFSGWPQGSGLVGGANLLQTSNYGISWTGMASLGTGNFSGISGSQYPVDNPVFHMIWYVRNTNIIYASYSGGQTWQIEHTAPAGTYTHLNGNDPGGPWWAVRTNGGISYHGMISGIQPISNEVPGEFKLYQNYPNPFNAGTKFKIQIPKFGLAKLVVYDVLGREVKTLVNQELKPGSYEITFDASNFPSGLYFYKLTANDFIETRKMMLIK